MAVLVILASFSPVVGFQTVESDPENVAQLLKNRLQKTLDYFKERNEVNLMLQKLISREPLIQTLKDIVDENGNNVDARFKSLVNRCSSFHDMVENEIDLGRMLFVLVLTILTEFFVYLSIVQAPASILFFISVLINAITNPATNFVYYYIYDNVLVLEIIVVIVESFMIFILFNTLSLNISFSTAVLLSLFANIASYIIATGLARLIYDVLPSIGTGG